MRVVLLLAGAVVALPAAAQEGPRDPFGAPIETQVGVVRVDYRELARLPDMDGEPARPTLLVPEPGGARHFVNDMRGPVYTVGGDGTVTLYLDVDDPRWGSDVQSSGRERGLQSFALHPQFNTAGAPGFDKLYTWADVTDTAPAPYFVAGGDGDSHDTVLLEWTARTPGAATYDGGPPRQVLRVQQPFSNHNGGQLGFNPTAAPGSGDFGTLYVGNADGGSGGDPLGTAQDLGNAFGKILRIDPLGRDAASGTYGIPADNPFVGRAGALGEIWALGVRNPQRFAWDPANGAMYVADIGQNIVEELSPVTRGANLGWNVWEGSFRYLGRAGVGTEDPRADAALTYPVAEFDHTDPILSGRSAITGVIVYRGGSLPALSGRIVFGDNPSGEVFHVSADAPAAGGQGAIRRVLLNHEGQARTLLDIVGLINAEQGREPASRVDLRFGTTADGEIVLLNKQDGVIRLLVAPAG